MTHFDVLVLAGGSSKRMGKPDVDKVALEVGGVALLDRVIAAAGAATRVVVVGPRRPTAVPVVWTAEQPVGGGPAAALAHGLCLLAAPVVVVLAADLPFAGSIVSRLVAALAHDIEAESAVAVDQAGRRQPLIAAYRVEALRRRVQTRASWADAAVRTLVAGLSVVDVAAAGLEALDCDTPEQLALARESASGEDAGRSGTSRGPTR